MRTLLQVYAQILLVHRVYALEKVNVVAGVEGLDLFGRCDVGLLRSQKAASVSPQFIARSSFH